MYGGLQMELQKCLSAWLFSLQVGMRCKPESKNSENASVHCVRVKIWELEITDSNILKWKLCVYFVHDCIFFP